MRPALHATRAPARHEVKPTLFLHSAPALSSRRLSLAFRSFRPMVPPSSGAPSAPRCERRRPRRVVGEEGRPGVKKAAPAKKVVAKKAAPAKEGRSGQEGRRQRGRSGRRSSPKRPRRPRRLWRRRLRPKRPLRPRRLQSRRLRPEGPSLRPQVIRHWFPGHQGPRRIFTPAQAVIDGRALEMVGGNQATSPQATGSTCPAVPPFAGQTIGRTTTRVGAESPFPVCRSPRRTDAAMSSTRWYAVGDQIGIGLR